MGTTSGMDHIAEKWSSFVHYLRINRDFKDIYVFCWCFSGKDIFFDIQVEAIHFQKSKTNNT